MAPEANKKPDTADTEADEKVPAGQMKIKVYAPFKNYFEGMGTSISGINPTGPFDILPGHHKFLTLLSPCELDVRTPEGTSETVKIERGIMYVKADRVTVFLDV